MLMWKSRKGESCYICGRPAETKDHIPPKGLFPEPRPTDLITFPACDECNNSYSKDDEYFRWFVATVSVEEPIADQLIDGKILPRLRSRPAFFEFIRRSFRRVDIFSEGGIWVGQSPAIQFDRTRLQRVCERIVKGLYLRHMDYRLQEPCYVRDFILQPKPPNEDFRRAVLSLPFVKVADGKVFCYHRWIHPKNKAVTMWFLWFFMQMLILVPTNKRAGKVMSNASCS